MLENDLGSILDDRIVFAVAARDAPIPPLDPAEAALVVAAVSKRKREFAFGRACARAALSTLGAATPGPILVGRDREPLWPPGVVGSITHCEGFCAAAVAWSRDLAGLGIDAEIAQPVPEGTAELILNPGERAWLRDRSRKLEMVFFSAKESVYKCLAPLTGLFLDFRDATLAIDLDRGSFAAEIHPPTCPVRSVKGRFRIAEGLVLTSAMLPAGSAPGSGAGAGAGTVR